MEVRMKFYYEDEWNNEIRTHLAQLSFLYILIQILFFKK